MTDNGNEGTMKALEVGDEDAGIRIDAWVASRMPPHVSRTRIKQLIKEGHITLNGEACREPNRRLSGGDTISLQVPEATDAEPEPENIPLDILFEDDHLIVVNKPAGMVVHPAAGNWMGTLVNALLHHCGNSLKGIGGVKRPGIVHRLDKETSGVMVVAKTEEALAGLAAQFADHGRTGPLERAYLAIVWGELPSAKGTIDAPLGRSSANRLKRAVVSESQPDARQAITHYTVVRTLDGNGPMGAKAGDGRANCSLVECRLETGRTHQIRVHMAHIGHPLVGDPEYGAAFQTKANALKETARTVARQMKRQALHAAVLGFAHPVTGETMRFEAPLPEDMQLLLEAFAAR